MYDLMYTVDSLIPDAPDSVTSCCCWGAAALAAAALTASVVLYYRKVRPIKKRIMQEYEAMLNKVPEESRDGDLEEELYELAKFKVSVGINGEPSSEHEQRFSDLRAEAIEVEGEYLDGED